MDKLLSVVDVAEWLGVSRWVINGWIRDKGLYVRCRAGRKFYLTKSDVTKFMDNNFTTKQKAS